MCSSPQGVSRLLSELLCVGWVTRRFLALSRGSCPPSCLGEALVLCQQRRKVVLLRRWLCPAAFWCTGLPLGTRCRSVATGSTSGSSAPCVLTQLAGGKSSLSVKKMPVLLQVLSLSCAAAPQGVLLLLFALDTDG